MITGQKHFLIYLAVVVLIGAGVGVWSLIHKNVTSHQFKGTVLEVRDSNLAMIGNYIESEETDPMIGGSKVVTVFFNKGTKITRNTVQVKNDSSFDKPIKPADQKKETITIAGMKSDLKNNNLVLTVNGAGNIYNLDVFTAESIEYTMLISKSVSE